MKPSSVASRHPGLSAALLRTMRREYSHDYGDHFDDAGAVLCLDGLLAAIFSRNGIDSIPEGVQLVDIAQAAEVAGVSTSTVTDWKNRRAEAGERSGVYEVTSRRRVVNLPEFLQLRGVAPLPASLPPDLDERVRRVATETATQVFDRRVRALLAALGDRP